MHPVLEVKELQKRFTLHTQNGATLDVLNGISIAVKPGEIAALCGPSGAGKSSLLKAVYGTYRVNGGAVLVHSQGHVYDISNAEPRQIMDLRKTTIGYVSQFLRVIPRVSTIDIVANAAVELGKPQDEAEKQACNLLEELRIPETLHGLSPLTFSGGEQQRVNIARALSAPRPLMLFDEPTASLDPENRRTVLQKIKELANNGTAVLGIFHDPNDRAELGAREIVMTETNEKLEDA